MIADSIMIAAGFMRFYSVHFRVDSEIDNDDDDRDDDAKCWDDARCSSKVARTSRVSFRVVIRYHYTYSLACSTVRLGHLARVTVCRGVDPYGTGGYVPPNIYEGGRPWQ